VPQGSADRRTPPLKGRCSFTLRLVFSLIGIIFFVTSILFFTHVQVLTIYNESQRKTLYRSRIPEGFEFTTLIHHSVQLTPVYEYYKVMKNNSLAVIKTRLQDLGWGMPSTEQGKVVFQNGFMELSQENKTIGDLRFRVSHLNSPALMLGNEFIPLKLFVEDGELLIFRVTRKPTMYALLEGDTNVFQEKTKSRTFP